MEHDTIPEQIEYFDDRYYRILINDRIRGILADFHPNEKFKDELFLTSSTTCLGIINKPFLSKWRGDIGNELADYKMNRGASIGAIVHDAIHKLVNFEMSNTGQTLEFVNYTQEEWIQIMRFKQWYDIFKPEMLASEIMVYNLMHMYAGTLDFVCKIREGTYDIGMSKPIKVPGGLYIGDLKTGKNVDKTANYQTASYAIAYEQMTGFSPDGTFILHTQSSTKAKWKFAFRNEGEMNHDLGIFLSAKKVWDDENPVPKPNLLMMPATMQLERYVHTS